MASSAVFYRARITACPGGFACNRLVHVRKSRNSFLFDIFKGVDVEKGPGLRPINRMYRMI